VHLPTAISIELFPKESLCSNFLPTSIGQPNNWPCLLD
jgi:hypothetical protein